MITLSYFFFRGCSETFKPIRFCINFNPIHEFFSWVFVFFLDVCWDIKIPFFHKIIYKVGKKIIWWDLIFFPMGQLCVCLSLLSLIVLLNYILTIIYMIQPNNHFHISIIISMSMGSHKLVGRFSCS